MFGNPHQRLLRRGTGENTPALGVGLDKMRQAFPDGLAVFDDGYRIINYRFKGM